MKKTNFLYVCTNDGSDMRVNKELKTIAKKYNIFFLGIGGKTRQSFSLAYCSKFYLVEGNRKSPLTILKFIIKLIFLLLKYSFSNVHVVNEQLYILLIPLLIRQKKTLDIFDSIFLKINEPNEQLYWIKKIIYSSVENIIVTDENRAKLLPSFAMEKTTVIPNVPFLMKYSPKIVNDDILTICYFGSLHKKRGSEFILNLIEANKNINILAAGWIGDSFTRDLLHHRRVEYLGVLKQGEINNILSVKGDYLLSIYPYDNLNNINASPNKIYDCIHTKTPIIINSEINVAQFVKKNNIGYVVNMSHISDYSVLGNSLIYSKNTYQFSDKLICKYCWENYENKLLSLYEIANCV